MIRVSRAGTRRRAQQATIGGCAKDKAKRSTLDAAYTIAAGPGDAVDPTNEPMTGRVELLGRIAVHGATTAGGILPGRRAESRIDPRPRPRDRSSGPPNGRRPGGGGGGSRTTGRGGRDRGERTSSTTPTSSRGSCWPSGRRAQIKVLPVDDDQATLPGSTGPAALHLPRAPRRAAGLAAPSTTRRGGRPGSPVRARLMQRLVGELRALPEPADGDTVATGPSRCVRAMESGPWPS